MEKFEVADRRVRKTRKAIRTALTDLLTARGSDQFTIKDIAASADIGYTTFFRHFSSKDAALLDLANIAAEELIGGSLPLIQSADSRAACLALTRHVDDNRALWNALLTGGASGAVRTALLKQTLERSAQWPGETSWLPSESGASLAVGLVVETLTWWLSQAGHLDAAEVAEIIDQLFISALVTQSDRRRGAYRK